MECVSFLFTVFLLLARAPALRRVCTQAMLVRGFQGPADHHLYQMKVNPTSYFANVCALALLLAYSVLIYYFK